MVKIILEYSNTVKFHVNYQLFHISKEKKLSLLNKKVKSNSAYLIETYNLDLLQILQKHNLYAIKCSFFLHLHFPISKHETLYCQRCLQRFYKNDFLDGRNQMPCYNLFNALLPDKPNETP